MRVTRGELGNPRRTGLPGSAARPASPTQPNRCCRCHRQHIRKLPPPWTARDPPIPRCFVKDTPGTRLFRAERNVIGCAARLFRHSTPLAVRAAHLKGTGGISSGKPENLLEVTCVGLFGIWRAGSCNLEGRRDPLNHHVSSTGI